MISDDMYIKNSEIESIYEEFLCEWKVDPKKKKAIITDALAKLNSEIQKDDIIKHHIDIYSEAKITTMNENILTRGKKYFENKKNGFNYW